ncbi:MAG: alkaline phosphatase [Saprospiraceae bacterium]|nr:alkaline phosphatase [Saprospiraceae bacterium]
MKQYTYTLLLAAVTVLLASCTTNRLSSETGMKSPKNIILLIGDGMGLTQVSTTYYYKEGESNFSRFKHIGLHQNQPTSHKVTDSASGATAFAAGVKTYNGAIGVDQDTTPVRTILEMLAAKGYHTALIATSSIVHATPASLYAHTASRSSYEEIARQLVYAPVNFFAGGGTKFFVERSEIVNYLDTLQQRGFQVNTAGLSSKRLNPEENHAFLLAPDGMPKMQEGRGDFLPKATDLALKYLAKDEDGFFLMVEGSQIDWGGHANDAQYVIQETLDFDKTLEVALDFAAKDKNTLVIVTADHETGGLSLSASTIYGQGDYSKITPSFSTGNHSAALIPVFAYGPGAEQFMGIYQNNEIFDKMVKVMKLSKR